MINGNKIIRSLEHHLKLSQVDVEVREVGKNINWVGCDCWSFFKWDKTREMRTVLEKSNKKGMLRLFGTGVDSPSVYEKGGEIKYIGRISKIIYSGYASFLKREIEVKLSWNDYARAGRPMKLIGEYKPVDKTPETKA